MSQNVLKCLNFLARIGQGQTSQPNNIVKFVAKNATFLDRSFWSFMLW
jgi:hypothetical protein